MLQIECLTTLDLISKLIYNSDYSIPDCIVGDFDSIRPEVQEYYQQKNVKLLFRYDQDYTDLEKCLYVSLERVAEYSNSNGIKNNAIFILGSAGGRVDHTFSTFSQVLKYINMYTYELKETDILLFSKSSISTYLKPGINKIVSSVSMRDNNRYYSIVPLFGETIVEIHEVEGNHKISNYLLISQEIKVWRKYTV